MKKAVLFCTCGGTISELLPPDRLRGMLESRLLSVCGGEFPRAGCEYFYVSPMLCRGDEARAALESALDAGAKAVVAAGCSLSARGFEAIKLLSGGISAEWADIRESCAWIHKDAPDKALEKAADIICMGLAALERSERIAELGRSERIAELGRSEGGAGLERRGGIVATKPSGDSNAGEILVIGGGPAGLACAGALGGMGARVILTERRPALGGMLPQLNVLFPDFISGPGLAGELIRDVERNKVRLLPGTAVSDLRGVPGGYQAVLNGKGGEERRVFDAVVLAVGALPVLPRGQYRYGELGGILSQMELETNLGKTESGRLEAGELPKQAVFLQCVAARDSGNPYCSAVCCPTALKNAIRLRALRPDGSVTVVHHNMATPGNSLESLYRRATAAGVLFRVRDPAVAPEPQGAERVEALKFRDALSGVEVILPADAVVCSTPLKPLPGTEKLAGALGLRGDDMGFVCGREPIQPVSPAGAGLFVCGAARWPATVAQCLEQGRAVAVKAAAYARGLGAGRMGRVSVVSRVFDELMDCASSLPPAAVKAERCSRCGRCAAVCPYRACFLPEGESMWIDAGKCARCGSCAAVCPTGAAYAQGEGINVLRARIKEALSQTAGGQTL